MKKKFKYSVFVSITIALFATVLSCNFSPTKINIQDEWDDDDEIRFTPEGVPMRKIGIKLSAGSGENARALNLAVSRACINYFEVTLQASQGPYRGPNPTQPANGGQIFRAGGSATLDVTTFWLWLPEDFGEQTIVDWNQGSPMICLGGYRHPKTRELYMLAFGIVTEVINWMEYRPPGFTGTIPGYAPDNQFRLRADTQSITLTMKALEFNVSAVKNPAITDNSQFSLGSVTQRVDPNFPWGNDGGTQQGTPPDQVITFGSGGYRSAAARDAYNDAAPFFIMYPTQSSHWVEGITPSPNYIGNGYSTQRDGNFYLLATQGGRYIPFFRLPANNYWLNWSAPIDAPKNPSGTTTTGYPQTGILGYIWIRGLMGGQQLADGGVSVNRFFQIERGRRPALVFRPVQHAAGAAVPAGVTLRKGHYPFPAIKGYLNLLQEDQFWGYDGYSGYGYPVIMHTAQPTRNDYAGERPWEEWPKDEDGDEYPMVTNGWVYMSIRVPFKVFTAPSLGGDPRDNWVLRTGIYDDMPDLGSEVLSLGGGILLRVGEPSYFPVVY